MNKVSPTVGHWQLFQNKITNAQQMSEGRWACLQLTEPFSRKVAFGWWLGVAILAESPLLWPLFP